jgi:hypothetical protein
MNNVLIQSDLTDIGYFIRSRYIDVYGFFWIGWKVKYSGLCNNSLIESNTNVPHTFPPIWYVHHSGTREDTRLVV